MAAESTEAREWSRFFSPMAHLCVFSSQQVSAPIQGRTPQEPQAASSVHDAPLFERRLGSVSLGLGVFLVLSGLSTCLFRPGLCRWPVFYTPNCGSRMLLEYSDL